MPNPLVIYGSTGHALAVREQACRMLPERDYQVAAYIDDIHHEPGRMVGGVPVISFERWAAEWRHAPVMITIGSPLHRRRLAGKIEAAGGRFETMVGDWPYIAGDIKFGEGSFVGGPCYIGSGVTLGRHVQVQPLSSIGHDTAIGDFTTICSSFIAGWVEIGTDVFIGIGTSIVHGNEKRPLRIGDGAFICAGSVVTKSIPAGARVMGNPARPLRELAKQKR